MSETTTSKGINVSTESNVELLTNFLAELAQALREDYVSTEDGKPDPDIPAGLGIEKWPTRTLKERWLELLRRAQHKDEITTQSETNDCI